MFKYNHFNGTCYLCKMHFDRKRSFFIGGALLLIFITVIDIVWNLGVFSDGISDADREIIRLLRWPRALTAMTAGAGLALAGTQMQGIFRNPLADPHIMGVSSGASLGAALVTMSGISLSGYSGISMAMASFAGALLTSCLILAVSQKIRSGNTLLIFGIMLGFIVNAVIAILQFTTDAESLKIYYSWSAGSFSNTTAKDLILIAPFVIAGLLIAIKNSKGLDLILFGDEFTKMSGGNADRIRMNAIISCCIITGAITAFCGPLGFVGIAAPHITRAVMGTSAHRMILPGSLLAGATLGLSADLLSQIPDSPIPVSSTMALLGIPVILAILLSKRQ